MAQEEGLRKHKKREKGTRAMERYRVKRRCDQHSRAERERCIKKRMVESGRGMKRGRP